MKKYLVWTDYGTEGWKYHETDTFEEAVKIREQQLRIGIQVIITKLVTLDIKEKD